jgi:hypothetical protein
MSHNTTDTSQAENLRKHYEEDIPDQPTRKIGGLRLNFHLDPEQTRSALEWSHDHDCTLTHHGAIGGAITYEFANTNLGQVQKANCACGAKHDMTDYNDW